MDLVEAITTRRSTHSLRDPAPDDDQFAAMLEIAAAAPDHGMLRPWRWILLRGPARAALGSCLTRSAPPDRRQAAVAKALRAPLMAILVFKPRTHHKVIEWEQLAATSNLAYGMMLLLHASGYGSIWRTGALCANPDLPEFLGLASDERTLGSLDIGTPQAAPAAPRPPLDIAGRISTMPHPRPPQHEEGNPLVQP